MLGYANCPKCEKPLLNIGMVKVDIAAGFDRRKGGVVYCCPACRTALSAGLDPQLLISDLLHELKRTSR